MFYLVWPPPKTHAHVHFTCVCCFTMPANNTCTYICRARTCTHFVTYAHTSSPHPPICRMAQQRKPSFARGRAGRLPHIAVSNTSGNNKNMWGCKPTSIRSCSGELSSWSLDVCDISKCIVISSLSVIDVFDASPSICCALRCVSCLVV